MMPTTTPGANVLSADNSTGVVKGVNELGQPYLICSFQPSYEDIQAINAGRPIGVYIRSNTFPLFTLFTVNENGENNL